MCENDLKTGDWVYVSDVSQEIADKPNGINKMVFVFKYKNNFVCADDIECLETIVDEGDCRVELVAWKFVSKEKPKPPDFRVGDLVMLYTDRKPAIITRVEQYGIHIDGYHTHFETIAPHPKFNYDGRDVFGYNYRTGERLQWKTW